MKSHHERIVTSDTPTIAVISSHTPSLIWFRMDMMREFIKRGYQVIALGPGPKAVWEDEFRKNGIEYRQFYVERNGLNPLKDLRSLRELYRFMKERKPNKVFVYQAKTVMYGSVAARLNGIRDVFPLIAGLGSVLKGRGLKNHLIKRLMRIEYWVAFKFSQVVIFQNGDDRDYFTKSGLVEKNKTAIVNGSGVNLDRFSPKPVPDEAAFLFIGRLIRDKGIIEYLEACREIKKRHPDVHCLLVGPYDSNPSALRPEELSPFIERGIVTYFGEQRDVRPFIEQCSTYVLPSYHEGTPKTVLEAMAMGRAVITTDAPGCKETVIDGVNGYLVTIRDIDDLVEKMDYLVRNPELNLAMGEASLKIAREKYDVHIVNQSIMSIMGIS